MTRLVPEVHDAMNHPGYTVSQRGTQRTESLGDFRYRSNLPIESKGLGDKSRLG